MGRRKKRPPLKLQMRAETVQSIAAIVLILLGLLVIISFSGQGVVLQRINDFLQENLGLATLVIPFVSISAGMVLFRTKWMWSKPHVLLGTIFIFFGVLGLFHTGDVGTQTFTNLAELVTPAGSYVIFISILVTGALIISQLSIAEVAEFLAKLRSQSETAVPDSEDVGKKKVFGLPKLSLPFGKKEVTDPFQINEGANLLSDESMGTAVVAAQSAKNDEEDSDEDFETPLRSSSKQTVWEYPPLSLLNASNGGEADRGDVKKNAQMIEETLNSFNIKAHVKEVNYGPSVTQYALQITQGTKLSKVTSLATDLALALAAPTGQIRIEAPIAGRNLVGVEVPNYSAQYVTLKKMLASKEMKNHPSKLATAMGINVSGEPVIMDIARMPHVLIAGATGSGKSVCINTLMCSILFRASPDEVKFILVDPKRVELTGYNDIPHLLTPVIVEPKKVVSALKWAVHEMNNRYKMLAEVGVKNIADYNELAGIAAMPNIVIIIDELADIMLFAPSEVEESITRIAQMARAVGIHLVLATQRPSVDVITGLIKANIPARVAFNVSSMTDSRVILDTPGAEKLLGKGDMLFTPPDQAKPSRVQGTYVSDPEIRSLIDFIKEQGQEPDYKEDITTKYKSAAEKGGGAGDPGAIDERDELFTQAAQFVASAGKGSSSMIQRKFSVGYNRAARILDQLHAAGMVGPQEGSKPREVNVQAIMEYLRSVQTNSN